VKTASRPVVLILLQNLPVPFDRRVWQESKALTAAGYQVHVICPRTPDFPAANEILDGVTIYRYRAGTEASRTIGYLREYGLALFWMLLLAVKVRLRTRVDVVHICNPPDLLFLPALPLVAAGAALIYDHHDACPELMVAKGLPERSRRVRLTRLCERLTYRAAHVSIETNDSYKQIALTRGGMNRDNVFVVRSAPEITRFAGAVADPAWRRGRKHLVAYVGVMGIQDGLDYLIDAARVIVHDRGRDDIQFLCIGGGPELDRLRERVSALSLDPAVEFPGRLSDADLGAALATADVCVNPDEVNRMNDISTMNKIMEYMALSKPMVQFELREGRVSAGDASLYAAPNDANSFAENILRLVDDSHLADQMGRAGHERLRDKLSWESQIPILLASYDRARLLRTGARSGGR
jgi:glycosyltransferase involved in cell wall biosynthesis